MNVSRYLILIACLLIGVSAVDDLTQTANDYIDLFIEKATNDSGGFIDPLPLDEIKHSFEREIAFVKVKGEAKIYDGKIFGLSSIRRKGNAVVLDMEDFMIISCELTFKKIHATYTGAILINDHGPKISIDAKVGSSNVSMFLMVPPEGGNSTLMSLNIQSLKDIRVSMYGLGPWGWAASIVSTVILNTMEKQVAKAASRQLFLHFSNEIDKVPFPGVNRNF